MKIYKVEKADGIAEAIKSNTSLAFLSALEQSVPQQTDIKKLDIAKATNGGQLDLFYLRSILASVGINKNDDFFDKEELWDARHTAEDKPFNYQHNSADIIGHITENYAITVGGETIDDATSTDEVPEQFHVLCHAVLYKYWSDEKLQERMNEVIKEIAENKWFVSMEAYFDNFDYAMIKPDKTVAVIKRNSETAFLSKHLRAYGGTGNYQNCKVGRLLRNIIFAGKGLVKNPANPDSIILNETEFVKSAASNNLELVYKPMMANTEKTESKMSKELEDKVAELEAKLKDKANASAEKEKALAEANEKLEKATSENAKLTAENTKLNAEKKRESRIKIVKAKLSLEDEKAGKLVDAMAAMDDKQFEVAVDTQAELMPKTPPVASATAPTEPAPVATMKIVTVKPPVPPVNASAIVDPANVEVDKTPALAASATASNESQKSLQDVLFKAMASARKNKVKKEIEE